MERSVSQYLTNKIGSDYALGGHQQKNVEALIRISNKFQVTTIIYKFWSVC
jgi:hypothetical protein